MKIQIFRESCLIKKTRISIFAQNLQGRCLLKNVSLHKNQQYKMLDLHVLKKQRKSYMFYTSSFAYNVPNNTLMSNVSFNDQNCHVHARMRIYFRKFYGGWWGM